MRVGADALTQAFFPKWSAYAEDLRERFDLDPNARSAIVQGQRAGGPARRVGASTGCWCWMSHRRARSIVRATFWRRSSALLPTRARCCSRRIC